MKLNEFKKLFNLIDGLALPEELSETEAIAEVHRLGYDYHAITNNADSALRILILAARRSHYKSMPNQKFDLQKYDQLKKEVTMLPIEEVRKQLNDMSETSGLGMAVSFRNYADQTEEDLRSLLVDLLLTVEGEQKNGK